MSNSSQTRNRQCSRQHTFLFEVAEIANFVPNRYQYEKNVIKTYVTVMHYGDSIQHIQTVKQK